MSNRDWKKKDLKAALLCTLALILHKNACALSAKGSFHQTALFSFNYGPWQGWGENSNAYVTRYLHRACERYSIAAVAPAPLARSSAAMLICATPPVHYLSAGRGSLRTVSLNAMSLPVMERCPSPRGEGVVERSRGRVFWRNAEEVVEAWDGQRERQNWH